MVFVMDLQVLSERFISGNCSRYILGRNQWSQSVVEALSPDGIEGFIDEFTKDESFMGVPIVHSLGALPENALVLSAALLNPLTAHRKLEAAGVSHIDYFSLLRFQPGFPIKDIEFWDGFRDSYLQRKDEYEILFNRLADEESRYVFRRIVDFRLSYDIDVMAAFTNKEKDQYFEPFLDLKPGDSFIDVGGYDGYTSAEFAKRCPDYGRIWFFEPEESNLKMAEVKLRGLDRIVYCPVAAYDKEGELRFEPSSFSSKVSSDGSTVVKCSLIDNYVCFDEGKSLGKIVMKMDIEGAESQAIAGAERTIREYHPTMAISVYHRGADLIDIPRQVLSIYGDYTIYLRHYTESFPETVMFFVPSGF